MGVLSRKLKAIETESFFYYWGITRKYTKQEFIDAQLLQLRAGYIFDPTGEECGTKYDELVACDLCGANRKQISPLTLKKGTIPKKDIAQTIGGEIVVSGKFARALSKRDLKGIQLAPIYFDKDVSDYYQLITFLEIDLSSNIVVGINPFDLSTSDEGEIYLCPKGQTIGLNLLSEACVLNSPSISKSDFFMSKQKIGVKRGLLRPQPIYFCSPDFREMINEEGLSGFEFEIANVG